MKTVKAWGVFSDDKLLWLEDFYYPGCYQPLVYKTRKQARQTGADVRPVLVTVLP